jgi:osmotically-inducible protein OsmY/predicted small secreted protein
VAHAHCSINAFILSCVAAFAIAGTAACQNTARGVQQDAQQAEEQTRDERADAANAVRDFGNDAAKAADRTGAAAAEAGEEFAERATAAWETVDVKGALMADASVDATRIDVDTNYETKTVTLNGSVPTETERNMAEVIATGRADGYTVVNNLQLKPRARN